jgi:twinkle protein
MTVKGASAGLLPTGEFKRLAARGISEETCRKFGYFIGKFRDGTTIQVEPYFNAAGELVAQHTRDAAKNFRWLGDSRAGLLFGQQLWGGGGRRVILTEGAIDCLSISQIQGNKWPVVSIKSGAQGAANDIKAALEWLESYQEIVYCFDMDEPGRAAAQKCAALISPGKAKIAHLPLKDANECLMNGKIQELTQALWNAKPYRPDGIVNIKDLKEKSRRSVPYGATFQYPELCEAIKGLRGGELILFTAGSGVGKSTIVHEIGHELNQKRGWPLGVLALEESTGKTARRYVGIGLNLPLVTPGCTVPDEEYDAAFDALAAREDIWFYDHFGSTDIDGILSKLRYLAVSCGARAIILDHISIIVSGLDEAAGGETERKTIDRLMTRLRSLVEETQVVVLAVVHLKRPPDKGKSWNEGREPALTDLRGSGALEQLSDVVVALGRDQQGDNPNLARIRVLKNRPVGQTGAAGLAECNPASGRLLPAAAAADSPFDGEDNKQPDF